ncbi:AraC family transcriptional regulator [Pseudomonas gingeri]|uniref:AraC family transcriptional regulator n=1 Tax=Pseudomonas gingeri TaxID=117681 RepID=UPI0015A292F7|nr:AraC family transcriptional regulator [Pseudomonas gingeri]NVZ62461.1 AraC family transcriptional regulator [Pseudomonas gingeri]NVZ76277.1 AraC family transcriptional regulator [Pseudomonas gingeri]
MTTADRSNTVHYWRSPILPGADMLTAQYHDQRFAPHWHDAYTLSVIEDGAQRYDYRGSRCVAEAGAVPVLNPGEVHTGSAATESGWRYRVFYLPVPFVQSVMDAVAGRTTPLPWFREDIIRDPDLTLLMGAAHRALQANVDPLQAEHQLLQAISTLLLRHAGQRPALPHLPRDGQRVAAMQQRLLQDLTEPVSLSELAREVGLSTFHAARLFTRATGLAPHAWRNQIRLNRALEGLRKGIAATDVATDSGFADLSHFTRHFKKAFGVPPGRWR